MYTIYFKSGKTIDIENDVLERIINGLKITQSDSGFFTIRENGKIKYVINLSEIDYIGEYNKYRNV